MKWIFFLLLLGPLAVAAQQIATGYVYVDVNGDGKKGHGEKGVPKVAVSNGVQVVLTDAQGKYSLPVTNDCILFVIKPSGYRLPLDKDNEPRFYYIHKPAGSPQFEYETVAPTGPLPRSVDFALIPQAEPDHFKALVFGDPQVSNGRELGYFHHDIVSELKGVKDVAFGLTLGDLVQRDLDSEWTYKAAVGEIGIPWYNVCGNHDLNSDCEQDSLNHESFEANYGPADYSFNYGRAHFIVLNDNLFPNAGHKKKLRAGFRPSQLEFIKNDLRFVDTSQLVVISFHCPINIAGEMSILPENRSQYFEILQHYPHVLSLTAHTHNLDQNFYTAQDGWNGLKPYHELVAGATCGNWYSGKEDTNGFLEGLMSDGTPRGYLYLNVSGNQYTADYKVAGQPAVFQIRLYHRKVLTPIWWDGRTSIYANFFMGYKDSKVECRIDDGRWKPMKYAEEADPYYLSQLYKWDESDTLFKGRRPTESANCQHLWTSPLPCNLGVGMHGIEVRATDVYGRVFVQKSSYRIEEAK